MVEQESSELIERKIDNFEKARLLVSTSSRVAEHNLAVCMYISTEQ